MTDDIYYNLGRLSCITESNIVDNKGFMLLNLTSQAVHALNRSGAKISLVDILEPSVVENQPKYLRKTIKYIKVMSNVSVKGNAFNNNLIQNFAKGFGINLEVDINNTYENVIDLLKQLKSVVSKDSYELFRVGVVNLFFVCNDFIKLPVIDICGGNDMVIMLQNARQRIIDYKNTIKTDKEKIVDYMKSVHILYEYILQNPVFDIGMSLEETGLSFATSSKAVEILCNEGILVQISGNQRYRIYKYTNLINIFN